jgi:hypothetical protein
MNPDVWQVLVLREDVWGRSKADILKILKRGVPALDTDAVWIPACDPQGMHHPDHDFAPYLLVPYPALLALGRVWCIERILPGSVTRKDMVRTTEAAAPLRAGQRIEVIDGPLVGLIGDVEAIRTHTVIVRVSLESGDRRVSVPKRYVRGV